MDLSGIGKLLLGLAVILALFGLVFLLMGRGVLPKLPGDMSFGGGNTRIYIPLGTSLLLSVVLTVLLSLFLRR
ncbi:MAG: DUF2905 family protein [Actinomycetota bacterium]